MISFIQNQYKHLSLPAFLTGKRLLILLGFLLLTSIVIPQVTLAQSSSLKITSLSDVESKAQEGSDTILNISKYVLGAVLGVSLIFVIYALATNAPHAKEYLLGWIIAVAIIMVAFLII